MIVRSAYLLAKNSFVEKQQERYEDTLKRANAFAKRYTNSRYSKDLATIIDQSKNKLNNLDNVGYQN
jgi:outer membrane protein assembly factor BamD